MNDSNHQPPEWPGTGDSDATPLWFILFVMAAVIAGVLLFRAG